ncbi:hypothetical protein AB0E69_11585 [Kribbella sp. NPDC026611]|uniref:effector-associated constant component EACC1 n=1 Tax=Kribbella sp. NPDC026611 TaxID=3154911 RepID=UPI0033F3000A
MEVWVQIALVDEDQELADRGIRQLRRQLAEFETRDVRTTAPAGSKGDAATVGQLVVAVGGAGGMVSVLVTILKDWLARRDPRQRVKVTIGADSIEVDAASAEERERLIESFLRKHEAS